MTEQAVGTLVIFERPIDRERAFDRLRLDLERYRSRANALGLHAVGSHIERALDELDAMVDTVEDGERLVRLERTGG
ncbi:MAG: hypothetical protein ACKVOP_06540 [Sphingomonadaceae bacterium]